MEPLFVVKIGGNVIDDEPKLGTFLEAFGRIRGHKILVHGGGKLATTLAGKLGIAQQMVEGRRITDGETLKVVTMVYAGLINKVIVAKLQAAGCNAMGLCGADGNAILAHRRVHATTDYGMVGDVDLVSRPVFEHLLAQSDTLVVAPITHDGRGQLLNTNADTIAQEIARAMSPAYATRLIYCFEKAGVLEDAADESTCISRISPLRYESLKGHQKIFAGMIPKLDNAFEALKSGVKQVRIGRAEDLENLVGGNSGTLITLEE